MVLVAIAETTVLGTIIVSEGSVVNSTRCLRDGSRPSLTGEHTTTQLEVIPHGHGQTHRLLNRLHLPRNRKIRLYRISLMGS